MQGFNNGRFWRNFGDDIFGQSSKVTSLQEYARKGYNKEYAKDKYFLHIV